MGAITLPSPLSFLQLLPAPKSPSWDNPRMWPWWCRGARTDQLVCHDERRTQALVSVEAAGALWVAGPRHWGVTRGSPCNISLSRGFIMPLEPMLSLVSHTATSCLSSLGRPRHTSLFHSLTFSSDTVALSSTIWQQI